MIIPGQLSAELAAVLAALLIPAVLAEPARRLALRYDLIDRSARHRVVFRRRIVPYLGGILVVVGTLVPALAVTGRIDIRLTAVVAGAVTVGILGFLRDLRRIALPFGMAMQAMMAFALAIGQVRLHVVQPGWLDIVLTALWVLGVANAFRLLDQVDGLLPTAVCATAVPLAAAAFVTDQPELAFLLVCFAAACCGFLLHNAPPMRIAMGASGGHFAGFLIAASAAVIRHADHATFDGMAMVMLVTSVAAVNAIVVAVVPHGLEPEWGVVRLNRLGFTLGPRLLLIFQLVGTAGAGLLAALVSGGVVNAYGTIPGALLVGLPLIVLLLQKPTPPPPPNLPRIKERHVVQPARSLVKGGLQK